MSSSILCAVTLDQHGAACLGYAWQRATTTQQALTIAHIAHQTMRTAGDYQMRNLDRGQQLLPLAELASKQLGEFVDDVLKDGTEANTRAGDVQFRLLVQQGIPGTRIPEIARMIDASSIVIGGTRRSVWQRRLWGCITCDVLRRARTPVFVVDSAGRPIDAQDFLPDFSGDRSRRSALGAH
ncbi:MAG: universal stress protein [Thiohalocapsa sp.]